jgi:hypothetical protein
MFRDQGGSAAGQVSDARRTLKNNRGAADDVLAHQSPGAAGDVLWQTKQALADYRRQQERCRTPKNFSIIDWLQPVSPSTCPLPVPN